MEKRSFRKSIAIILVFLFIGISFQSTALSTKIDKGLTENTKVIENKNKSNINFIEEKDNEFAFTSAPPYHIEITFNGFTWGFPVKIDLILFELVPVVWAKSKDASTGKVGHFKVIHEGTTILDMDAEGDLKVEGWILVGEYDLHFINLNGGKIEGKIWDRIRISSDGYAYEIGFN